MKKTSWVILGSVLMSLAVAGGSVSAQAEPLITAASDTLNPQRQYYVLLERYRRGQRDLAVMPYLARSARAFGDHELAATIVRDYIDRAPPRELLTSDNLLLVAAYTAGSSDPGFAVFRRYADRIDHVLGVDGFAQGFIDAIVIKEEMAPRLRFNDPLPDWEAIAKAITRKYGAADAERLVAEAKQRRWNELQQMYADELHIDVVNNPAWDVFERSSDPEELSAAIAWMARAVEQAGADVPAYALDTYANLLYKADRVDEAIAWEEKAVAIATAQNDPEAAVFQEALGKMKKGEPTWPQR